MTEPSHRTRAVGCTCAPLPMTVHDAHTHDECVVCVGIDRAAIEKHARTGGCTTVGPCPCWPEWRVIPAPSHRTGYYDARDGRGWQPQSAAMLPVDDGLKRDAAAKAEQREHWRGVVAEFRAEADALERSLP